MTPAALKLEKASIEKQVDLLLAQYQAVSDKALYENNPATKVVLEKQAEQLLEECEAKQTELEQSGVKLS